MRDRHAVDAALLGVGRLLGPDRQLEVELIEGGGPGLAQPGAGQHAEADDPGGALILVIGQRVGQTPDLLERQEPLARGLGSLAEAQRRVVGRASATRTARLNILRSTSPTRFARTGVGLAGFSGFLRFPFGWLLRRPRPPLGDLGQQPIDVVRRDLRDLAQCANPA